MHLRSIYKEFLTGTPSAGTAVFLLLYAIAAAALPNTTERPASPPIGVPVYNGTPDTPLRAVTPPQAPDAPLFGCGDCEPGRRQWFTDVTALRNAALLCGFDFLSLRFTQDFSEGPYRGRLIVFGRTVAGDSVVVDSALSVCVSPAGKAAIVTVYHHERSARLILPLPGRGMSRPAGNDGIDGAVRLASTFRSSCTVRGDSASLVQWRFLLNNKAYLVEKGRVLTVDAQASPVARFTGEIAYRLETWGSSPQLSATPFRGAPRVPPEIIRFDVNDSMSICGVRLECTSQYGLSYCIIDHGADARDTIDLKGARRRSVAASVSTREGDSIVSVTVYDRNGNHASASRAVFGGKRQYRELREHERMVAGLTRERARGNPFTYGAYLLSQLDGGTPITCSRDTTPDRRYSGAPRIDIGGNPVGSALKKIFREKSEAFLAAIADPPPAHPLDPLTFPQPGMVHDGLLAASRGEYALQLFGDRFSRNGTRIAELVNPTLASNRIAGTNGYTIRCSAPLSRGRYPAAWSVAPSTGSIEPSPSALLFCASAECRGRDITLYDLPFVLPKPENRVSFTLYHATRLPQADTLTFTWCIRYTDRSSERVSHSYSVGNSGTVGTVREVAGPVSATPYAVINIAGERCLILPIRVQGEKDIFRVDAFVHSLVKNEIVGWGSASCRG